MLTRTELVELERSLREDRVLSVYIDGTEMNAAAKGKWRLDLAHSLQDLRAWLDGSPREERQAFDRCVALLERELDAFAGAVGAPGWVAFITPTGVQRAERVPVPTPTIAVWSTGASIARYMRILKEARPIIMLVVDARKGRLYKYRIGELAPMKTVHAHTTVEPPLHMGNPPRAGFHAGVRGLTGRDAAQRALLTGTRRMTRELALQAVRLAGPDGWILTGGIPEVATQMAGAVARLAPGRVRALESLDVHASDAEIAAAARKGASAMRDAFDLAQIDEIVERANGGSVTALGPAATREALGERRVRELYLTHRYLEHHAAEAESAVRSALAQGATVEEVSHAPANQLDEYGGIGARLRYVSQRRQAR